MGCAKQVGTKWVKQYLFGLYLEPLQKVCVCVCVCVYSYIYLNHFAVQQKLTLYINYESESEVAQSCPTLCDPMDYSLPGSSVHGIFQARILEWVAISFSRRSSQPRD